MGRLNRVGRSAETYGFPVLALVSRTVRLSTAAWLSHPCILWRRWRSGVLARALPPTVSREEMIGDLWRTLRTNEGYLLGGCAKLTGPFGQTVKPGMGGEEGGVRVLGFSEFRGMTPLLADPATKLVHAFMIISQPFELRVTRAGEVTLVAGPDFPRDVAEHLMQNAESAIQSLDYLFAYFSICGVPGVGLDGQRTEFTAGSGEEAVGVSLGFDVEGAWWVKARRVNAPEGTTWEWGEAASAMFASLPGNLG